jgi:RNA polymerase sigma-70 factor (ECF subfamily)
MQVLDSHIGDKQQYAAYTRQQGLKELENAVSQYMPSLYRRAYRYVGDPQDAEDPVQDALLSACKHLDQFEGKAKMTTWLTSIVTNCALGQLRKRPRQPHVSLDERLDEDQDYCALDRLADAKPDPENECIWSELHGRLLRHVTELSPSMRKAIQLRGLEGMTTRGAANNLGLSNATVKSQVSRARTKLRRLMRDV